MAGRRNDSGFVDDNLSGSGGGNGGENGGRGGRGGAVAGGGAREKTETEKRELRKGYRQLIDDLDNVDLGESRGLGGGGDANEAIKDRMDRAVELYKNVETPQEIFFDAQAFKKLTNLVRNQAKDASSEQSRFHLPEYVTLVTQMLGGSANDDAADAPNRIPAPNWIQFGSDLAAKLAETGGGFTPLKMLRVPALSYLYGGFGRGAEVPAAITAVETFACSAAYCEKTFARRFNLKQHEKRAHVAAARPEPTRVTRVATQEIRGHSENETEARIKSMREQLRKLWRRKQKKINYFRFVIDPDDFGVTVENMFYVCFLVKDYTACLSYHPDTGMPELQPIEDRGEFERLMAESAGDDADAALGGQALVTITMRQWKELIDVLGIEEAAIKRDPGKRAATIEAKKKLRSWKDDDDDYEADEHELDMDEDDET